MFFFFFKQKTAYEMRISDWSSDVCSSDLYSAEVLHDAGIKNVSVIGCPSVFRSLQPTQKIRKKPFSQDLRVGLTLNKYLAGEYAEDQIKALRLQREFLVLLAGMQSSVLYSQGEKDEFRSEEHTYELQSLMLTSYAVFCLQ